MFLVNIETIKQSNNLCNFNATKNAELLSAVCDYEKGSVKLTASTGRFIYYDPDDFFKFFNISKAGWYTFTFKGSAMVNWRIYVAGKALKVFVNGSAFEITQEQIDTIKNVPKGYNISFFMYDADNSSATADEYSEFMLVSGKTAQPYAPEYEHTPPVEIHGYNQKLSSGKVTQGINSIDSFNFTMSPKNSGFNRLLDFSTLVSVYNTNKNRYEFYGRILYQSDKMDESGLLQKEVTCESYLGFLCDSQQLYVAEQNWTVDGLLKHIVDTHNSQVEAYKHFAIGTVNVTDPNNNLYCGIQRENSWETIKKKLIDVLGGEIRFRVVGGTIYLDYLTAIGSEKETEIALSRNMKAIVKETDPTEFITRVIPVGAKIKNEKAEAGAAETDERVTIAPVNNGVIYIDDEEAINTYGIHTGYVEFDDVTEPSILLSKGTAWLKENNKVKIKYSITALDLSLLGLDIDDLAVYNSHPIKNALLGIDDRARIVKKNIDVCEEVKSTIEIGENFKTLSELQIEHLRKLEESATVIARIEANYVTNQELTNTANDINNNVDLKITNERAYTTSLINQLSDEISLEVSAKYVTQTEFETYEKEAAAKLELKVGIDEDGNLIGAIHIGADQLTIDTDNFKLNADGSVEVTGRINATYLSLESGAFIDGVVGVEALSIYNDTSNGTCSIDPQRINFIEDATSITTTATLDVSSLKFAYKNGSNYTLLGAGLEVVGDDTLELGVLIGKGYISGTWTAQTAIGTASDENLKHDIEALDDKYSALFDSLTPVRYKYNDGASNRFHTGFIAQDVEKAITDAGLTTQEFAAFIQAGDHYALRYEEFIALCVEQIQKLKKKVSELESNLKE